MANVAERSEVEDLAVLSDEFESAPASEVVRWAYERFGRSVSLACSFQDCVIVACCHAGDPRHRSHLLGHRIPFPRDPRIRRGGEVPLRPQSPHRDARARGRRMAVRDRRIAASCARSSRCTGRSRAGRPGSPGSSASTPRAGRRPIVSWDEAAVVVKVNPIATWTDDDIDDYVADHDLPRIPHVEGLPLDRLRTDDPSGRARRGSTRRSVGRAWARPSAACTSENLAGSNGSRWSFCTRFARSGELNQVERWKLERHPLEVADAVIDALRDSRAPTRSRRCPGEAGAAEVGRPLPAAPGRRRVHDAGEGPRRAAQRRPGPRDRRVADALRRGPRRQPRLGQPLLRHHHPPGHPDPLDPHRRRAGDLAALRRGRAHDACRRAATRRATSCAARWRASTPTSSSTPCPIAQAISEFFTGNREYANLPRKFKMSVTGCVEDCAQAEINDIGLWPARTPTARSGSTCSSAAGSPTARAWRADIDVFVGARQAVECTRAIAQLFGELGNRENRGLARMRYLVQELGPEGFRAELAARAAIRASPGRRGAHPRYRGDHVGVHPEHERRAASTSAARSRSGGCRGIELVEAARLAETYGDGDDPPRDRSELRPHRRAPNDWTSLLGEELLQKYSPYPGPFERGVVACTGSEFCRFAIVETKERAVTLGASGSTRSSRPVDGPRGTDASRR